MKQLALHKSIYPPAFILYLFNPNKNNLHNRGIKACILYSPPPLYRCVNPQLYYRIKHDGYYLLQEELYTHILVKKLGCITPPPP